MKRSLLVGILVALLAIPVTGWAGAKLKISEMGSRYFFIVAYVWLEKHFSRGDYSKAVDG